MSVKVSTDTKTTPSHADGDVEPKDEETPPVKIGGDGFESRSRADVTALPIGGEAPAGAVSALALKQLHTGKAKGKATRGDAAPVDETALFSSIEKTAGTDGKQAVAQLKNALDQPPWSDNPKLRQTLVRAMEHNLRADAGTMLQDVALATQTARTLSQKKLDAPTTAKLTGIAIASRDPQTLALADKSTLLSAVDFRGGKLIDHLDQIATQPLGAGIDRAELLQSVTADLFDPGTMAQGDKGTCAATSVAYRLARERPAEYARLVAGVASPGGTVALANGAGIAREEDRAATGRRLSGALLFPALMEQANVAQDYSNSADAHVDASGNSVHSGLFLGQIHHLSEAVFGKKAHVMVKNGADIGGDVDPTTKEGGQANTINSRVTTKIPGTPIERVDFTRADRFEPEEYLRGPFAKRSVLAMDFAGGGHAVVFESFGNDGRVYFFNPWGGVGKDQQDAWVNAMPGLRFEDEHTGLQSLPQAEFFTRLWGVVR